MNTLKSMFNSNRSQRTPNPLTESARTSTMDAAPADTFSLDEMMALLQVPPERLRQWSEIYPDFLEAGTQRAQPRYSRGDLATLIVIQRLLEAGHEHEQVIQRLQHNSSTLQTERSSERPDVGPEESPVAEDPALPLSSTPRPSTPRSESHSPVPTLPSVTPRPYGPATSVDIPKAAQNHAPVETRRQSGNQADDFSIADPSTAIQPLRTADGMGELLRTVASNQQSVLNVQDSIREMLGVMVQDNFNLKNENRKLRERMLEIERTLAEYQRREETRKERLEGRLRAVESTLSAIQQQVAQLVQLYRQRTTNKRGWFR